LALIAQLSRKDDAIRPGHPLRAASEAAIEVIATEEAGGFAADAQRDLFGLADETGGPLVVRATREWVMFHRRRDKQCGDDRPAPETGVRRYQVYYLTAKSEGVRQRASAAVLAADAALIARVGFKPVTLVEYAIGASGVLTPEADLIADLQAAGATSDTLVFGAIGSVGSAQGEGDTLARTRLTNLELILGEDGIPDAANNEVLPVLPDMGQSGLDGLIFLIAMDAGDTCQEVYVAYNDDYDGVISEGGLLEAIDKLPLRKLGEVVFPGGGTEPTHESLDAVGQEFVQAGTPVVGVSYRDADGSADATRLLEQSQRIMEALGGDPTEISSGAARIADATTCAGATVIFATRGPKVVLVLWNEDGVRVPRIVEVPYDQGEPQDITFIEAQVKEAILLKMSVVEPWAATQPRLDKAKALNEPIAQLVRDVAGVEPRDIEVINTDWRQRLTDHGIEPDDYDLLVSFRRG
jgi:hypothetical protein